MTRVDGPRGRSLTIQKKSRSSLSRPARLSVARVVPYQFTGATPRPASRTVIVRVMMVVVMVPLPGNMIWKIIGREAVRPQQAGTEASGLSGLPIHRHQFRRLEVRRLDASCIG